jgi:hypothetical protein
MLGREAEKSTYLNELDVRKPFIVASTSQSREALRLRNLVENLTI